MKIIVNEKRVTKIGEVESGAVFRFEDSSQYWLATNDWYDSKSRHCISLPHGSLEGLYCETEVVVVECKMEINE